MEMGYKTTFIDDAIFRVDEYIMMNVHKSQLFRCHKVAGFLTHGHMNRVEMNQGG